MLRKYAILALKIVVVAALMAFVFYNVEWQDKHVKRSAPTEEKASEVRLEEVGKILGKWDAPEVRFRAFDEDGELGPEQLLVPGSGADGLRTEVTPGFTTFVLSLDWTLFALGALCYAASVVFAATRWWWLLSVNGLQVSWWTAIRFTWIGLFFNNVMPGLTGGDAIKAIYIMKHCHGGRLPALVSVFVDRILGLGSLALLGAVVVLFALDRENFGTIAIGIWAVLAAVGMVGVVAFSRRIRRAIRLDELLNRLPPKLSVPLKHVDQAVYFYRGHTGKILVWLLLGMGNHAVSVGSVLLIGEALRVGMGHLEYFVLVPVINVVTAIPLAPAGWGIGEFAFRELFGTFGAIYITEVPQPTAEIIMGTRGVALSVLFRIHITLWSLLGGLLMLVEKDKVTRQDIEDTAAFDEQQGTPDDSGGGGA